jgi:hypothetical protein
MKAALVSASLFLFINILVFSQDTLPVYDLQTRSSGKILGGFVRGGLYSWVDKTDDKLYIPSAFSDVGLKLETGNGNNFRAFADLRFRYGTEFQEPVSKFDVREAWVGVYGKKWNMEAGQKIIKWGRCDFTNPTSKLSPQDLVLRSPDREDMNLGNLLAKVDYSPWEKVNFEAVIVPYYRPSVLIIDPIPLPDYVVINEIKSLQTDKEMFSYGLKADFRFKMFDWSLSWFNGYDPMPGIALTTFSLDFSQTFPVPYLELSETPYKNRVLGIDFETAAGPLGIRGEAAWSDPVLSYETNEYVPLPEVKYAAGIDWATGIWRFTGEYSGKYIIDFSPAEVDPIIGTDIDYMQMAAMFANPEFDPEAYVKQQVEAFNRLYNYQLNEYYHSAGLRVEAEMLYGKFLPSIFTIYNFTSRDLLIIPEMKIKPADGLAITVGAEIYSGIKNSVFDLIDDFMNGVYVSLRVDF